MKSRILALAAAAALLGGCSGTSGQSTLPTANPLPATSPIAATTGPQGVKVRMIVGDSSASTSQSHLRKPQFISNATKGVNIALTGAATQSVQADISPGSATCGGSSASPRTCTITISHIPTGTYTITATSYDALAIAGSFSAAHELASGSTSVVVSTGQTPSASFFMGGLIAKFSPSYISVPASGTGRGTIVGMAINPQDYDNEVIASSSTPYVNPITVTLTESGGTGHESLMKNLTGASSAVTLYSPADTVQVNYDGLGSPGYTGAIAVTASGATTQNFNVSPMYVVPASYASGSLATGYTINFLGTSQTSALAITEAASSTTYTSSSTGCTNIATVSAPTGSGPTGAATITDGTTASASGCTISITDSVLTTTKINVAITNTTTNGGLTIPAQTVETSVSGAPNGIAVGADGRIWFGNGSASIGAINPATMAVSYYAATGTPVSLALGPDGNIWYVATSAAVYKVTTAGTVTPYTGIGNDIGITAGPDGRMWVAGTSGVFAITTAGTTAGPYGVNATSITTGSDGRLWYTESGVASIGAVTTAGVTSSYTGLGSTTATSIIADGNSTNQWLWFADTGANKIGKILVAGAPITEYATTSTQPVSLTYGPDANLWYGAKSATTASVIGKMTTAGVPTEYLTPTVSANPSSMTVGTDGRIWFTEMGQNKIGASTP